MNKVFSNIACRNIITLWASTYELQVSSLKFPTEDTVVFSVLISERLPVLAITRLHLFLGSGLEVKTTINSGGQSVTITIKNYQSGRISALWNMHEFYFGR